MTEIIDEMMELLRQAMNGQYAITMPTGFSIYLLAEYDEKRFPAPNLWFEKRQNPKAKYVVILTSDSSSVPALGETVSDAIAAAIAKIESYSAVKQ